MEESADKIPEETTVTAEGEGAEEQKKEPEGEAEGVEEGVGGGGGGGEEATQTSIFQSPLRLVRKTKMKLVVCRVSLLDGTDFTCEVEVRLRQTLRLWKLLKHTSITSV